jgi:hypothetical protein
MNKVLITNLVDSRVLIPVAGSTLEPGAVTEIDLGSITYEEYLNSYLKLISFNMLLLHFVP